MAIPVDVSLRIPNVKNPALDENGYPIDHSAVRFSRTIDVESIPKPGVKLQLATRSGRSLECEVIRSDWHEARAIFVVSCRYANRSISPDDYQALLADPDWQMKPLI